MRIHRTLVLGASLALVIGSAAVGEAQSPLPSGPVGDGVIKMGSAGFYESALVAEMYAQAIEATGVPVERRLDTGQRAITWEALKTGADINIMPEYIGSFLREALGAGELATGDAQETHDNLAAQLAPLDFSVLGYTPAVDTNAFVVTQATADQYSLASMGDLAKVAGQLSWGLPPECATNPSCGGALARYGIDVATLNVTELGACGGEIAAALVNGGVRWASCARPSRTSPGTASWCSWTISTPSPRTRWHPSSATTCCGRSRPGASTSRRSSTRCPRPSPRRSSPRSTCAWAWTRRTWTSWHVTS